MEWPLVEELFDHSTMMIVFFFFYTTDLEVSTR